MIVCVCNAIREEDLRAEVRKGATTPARAYAKCGSCLPFACKIIAEERAELDSAPEAAQAA
jgi:bacterioferritin-associated ferredoxin